MKTIKLGIIGCGDVTTNKKWHIASFRALNDPDAELLALADKIPSLAKETAGRFNVPLFYDDYKKMLENPEINAVSVCTRTPSHKEIALDVLKAGKHVFIEKPITSNREELLELTECALENKKILVAGSNGLHLPQISYLKKLMESGEMGEVYLANVERIASRSLGSDLSPPPKARYGVSSHNASHSIEWTVHLLGNPKTIAVSAKGFGVKDNISRPFEKREEDDSACIAQILFENGVIFQFRGLVNSPIRNSYKLAFTGDKMSFEYDVNKAYYRDGASDSITLFRHGELLGMEVSHPVVPCESGHGPIYNHFFTCIRENRIEVSRCERGLETMKILDAIQKSMEMGGKQILL